jgi:hypothetical protein
MLMEWTGLAPHDSLATASPGVWNPVGEALCRQFLQLKRPRYRHIMTDGRGRRDYVYVYVFDALRLFVAANSLPGSHPLLNI